MRLFGKAHQGQGQQKQANTLALALAHKHTTSLLLARIKVLTQKEGGKNEWQRAWFPWANKSVLKHMCGSQTHA